jgi:hypothetical protein
MAEPALMLFADKDEFLRRVDWHSRFKRDVLLWKAFNDQHPRMSWTFRNGTLKSDAALDAYHAYFSERFGESLPAILWFTFHGLTRRIVPPLEPQLDPDSDDPMYGHLHCSTDALRDKEHRERLAKLVNDGVHAGIARRYPKHVL